MLNVIEYGTTLVSFSDATVTQKHEGGKSAQFGGDQSSGTVPIDPSGVRSLQDSFKTFKAIQEKSSSSAGTSAAQLTKYQESAT